MSFHPDRVLSDLRELARFGAHETGVHRPTFSDEDMAARRWYMAKLAEAGLDASMDGIGNVYGLSPGGGPKILAGSHLESQNHAGWLDGALGCVYALEAARAVGPGIEVASWADEEGHYGNFIGSKSFVGLLDEAEIDRTANKYHGEPLRQALARVGLAGLPRRQVEAGRYRGFVEAHIEQGDTLEGAGLRIGVVTAIVAIWQYRITATGQQNHAGTTSMARRRDAGLAIVRLLAAIDREFPEVAGPRSVWTTGRITLEPGAPSIIPGEASCLFQFRDADPGVLDRVDARLRELAADAESASGCPIRVEAIAQSRPALMDPGLQDVIEVAANSAQPGCATRMPSGAGHDAQYLARVMPAAMLFVPSIGGISHHPAENTSDADIAFGARVYCDALSAALSRRLTG